jgi:MFS family permease
MDSKAKVGKSVTFKPGRDANDEEAGGQVKRGQKPQPSRRRTTLSRIKVTERTCFVLDGVEQLSLGEIIDDVGFGPYQVHTFIISAGALMSEAALIEMFSSVAKTVSTDFGIESDLQKAMFVAFLFAGIQLGTVASGPMGDFLGRRWPVLLGYCGMLLGAVAAFFSPNMGVILVIIVLTGVSAGICVPAAMITLTEVMPSRLRGVVGAAIGMAWRLGWLWAAFGLRLFMPDLKVGPWRLLVLWAAAPAVLFLCFAVASPAFRQDSPHFLAIRGDGKKLIDSINLVADMNGRPDRKMVFDASIRKESSAALTFRETVTILMTYPFWQYFCCMVAMFFSKEFLAAGLVAFWPVAFSSVSALGSLVPATGLAVTTFISIPGIFVAMYLMYWLPRRTALWTGTALSALSALLILNLDGSSGWQVGLGLVGVASIQLFFPTWQMVTMLLVSEVFPTQVRGWAFSLSFFLGRFGSSTSSVVVNMSQHGFLVACACLAGVAALAASRLPETQGVELTNFTVKAEEAKLVGSEKEEPLESGGYGAASKPAAATD